MRLLIALLILLCPLPTFAQPSPPVVAAVDASVPGVPEFPALAPSAAPDAPAPTSDAPSTPPSLIEIPGVVVSGPVSALVSVAVPGAPEDDGDTLSPLPGDDDVFATGKEAFEAVKAARRAPTLTGIAAAIVAGIMLLIAVARRFGGLLLSSNQLRGFVIIAAALAGGIAQVADGMGWTEVLFVALAPVLSVGLHQILVKPLTRKGGRPTADRP